MIEADKTLDGDGGVPTDDVVVESAEPDYRTWERKIRAHYRERCGNCGSGEKVRVSMIVPVEAGGQLTLTNGAMLCRICEMAADAVARCAPGADQRLVNFWVSRALFDGIKESIERSNTFSSMGSLVRYLVGEFIDNADWVEDSDDLALYQDEGSDVKVNVWVERDNYARFKAMLDERGSTVTDTLKGLILWWRAKVEPQLAVRSSETSVETKESETGNE